MKYGDRLIATIQGQKLIAETIVWTICPWDVQQYLREHKN